ncbi:hypothetical protein DL95DRAFT_469641 [Leptodontidium sp. 2 PMI_412]|nr:hypothetical protein DL95DRAFT_469641 [Leptodontidium sp. 2 PMI_412]
MEDKNGATCADNILSTRQQVVKRVAVSPPEDAQCQNKKHKRSPQSLLEEDKGKSTLLSPEELEAPFLSIAWPKSQAPTTESTLISPLGLFEKVPYRARCIIYRYVLEPPKLFYLDRDYRTEQNGHQRLHNTDILWTCKGIYQGAVSVLYQETTLLVHAEDIYHLEADFASLPGDPELKIPRKSIWRHNPLGGPHTLGGGGGGGRSRHGLEYEIPTLDGYMEPHVFSRFQHIHFVMPVSEINFGCVKFIAGTPRADFILKGEPDEVKPEFLNFMGKVNIPRILGRILKSSPCIALLNLVIHITGVPLDPTHLGTLEDLHRTAAFETARLGVAFKNHQDFEAILELKTIRSLRPSAALFHHTGTKFLRCNPSQLTVEWLDTIRARVEGQWKHPLQLRVVERTKEKYKEELMGFDKSSMPFEWKKYILAMNRLKKIAGKHDKYEVGKKSRLWWSKIFAEDGLGQSLGFVSAPDSLEQPSSVLPSIPCLQIFPCDICYVL